MKRNWNIKYDHDQKILSDALGVDKGKLTDMLNEYYELIKKEKAKKGKGGQPSTVIEHITNNEDYTDNEKVFLLMVISAVIHSKALSEQAAEKIVKDIFTDSIADFLKNKLGDNVIVSQMPDGIRVIVKDKKGDDDE